MHDLTPMLSLGATALFAVVALVTLPAAAPADRVAPPARLSGPDPQITALRDRGPAALDELLAVYDHATPAERDALEATIDAVAAQRYATVSRLYWYTDLARAKQAARQLHRPILALRMLGDLRDDLSCANSRLFRATLYANTQVSGFLRSHFVLYWSSERAVPTVTIDFGDGRKIVRTTTGNSAHYVLDEDGRVVDVLPGLYAPQVFQRELTDVLAFAAQLRGLTAAQRRRAMATHHAAMLAATDEVWQRVAGTRYVRGAHHLPGADDAAPAIARAQRMTVSKAVMEVPDLQAIGLVQPGEVPDDAAAWSAIAGRVWPFVAQPPSPGRAPARGTAGAAASGPRSLVLDAASRALVTRLHNAGPADQRASAEQLAEMIARLEQHLVADTALDQLTLRQAIRRRLVEWPDGELSTLNAWIYDVVFATPRTDPWLGLRARTEFSGLPGDGVVMP